MYESYCRLALAIVAAAALSAGAASAHMLTNGPGDGTVSVGVDAFGSFGSAVSGSGTTDALFDPAGITGPAGTSFESGVAIGFGAGRTFMTSGDIGSNSGGAVGAPIAGGSTAATSGFTVGGLTVALTQTLTALFTGGTQTGSVLTQNYALTNTGGGTLAFDIIRYLDGDLLFNGTISDGGGRLFSGGTEILFETDSATGTAAATTFVGITAEGGTIPTSGRYEIDIFSGLRNKIISGGLPDDTVTGDGADADQFVDAGPGYDVTLALRNTFNLLANASATYTTRTIFGEGAPDTVTVAVPEPAPIAAIALALIGLGAYRSRRKP